MSVICLEGASAVGKTTLSQHLAQVYGYKSIAEVNELCSKPFNASTTWYFERQVERWQQAKITASQGQIAILDGDPFQPLWYNWIYRDGKLQPIDEVFHFYEKMISTGEIEFPANYYILTAPTSTLVARKKADQTRTRRNFDKHLKLIKPQYDYFKFMATLELNSVTFIESDFPSSTAKKITESNTPSQIVDHQALFEAMRGFIAVN